MAEQKKKLKDVLQAIYNALKSLVVQSDYAQNDSTQPDYIKNRTHYVENVSTSDVWYQGYWTVQKEYAGDSVIGLKITLHTNAPYGYSRIIKHFSNETAFDINVNTDEEGYIYPTVTIQLAEGGELHFINTTENRDMELKNCVAGETITIENGDVQQIGSTNTAHDWIHEFNYKYPRFVTSYGNLENHFTINKQADITLEYREIRKVGLK